MDKTTTDKKIKELVERFGEVADMIRDANVRASKIAADLADIIVKNATIKKDTTPEKSPGPIRLRVSAGMDHAVSDFFNEIDKMLDSAKPRNKKASKPDMVSHPKHYQGKMECIDAMEKEFGKTAVEWFCLLNAFKYEYRKDKKGKHGEDSKKRDWYIGKFNELRKGKNVPKVTPENLEKLANKYK